ncbi:oxygen-dependent tRNA uridine(34) hydroxylase TrhO [Chlorogloea sp. CCALA 695]|uniref:oxygen-dependent tRNA uridine(34) hydroxylase TrhO n=1 Tax=Chlorogloea sp. CCALA 695 TaxID=2107693 RepID=UPI000D04D6E0|nr:rhodanese-related sulfurtransferase [Chlorogloea sp. CCALA 695]PSB30969.1 hypothetical protein C7B70_14885 [Chlorogloea sp. CCALA 695]
MTHIIASFYKFVPLPDFADKKQPLLSYCQVQNVKGSILLAAEGINGTIASVSRASIDGVVSFLRSDLRLKDLEYKLSSAQTPPFERMKVRLKREIVTLGLPVNPIQQVGTYVTPTEWNALINDPEVTIIDTRNDYEVDIGTFKGAQNPNTSSFNQFPDYIEQHLDPAKHKKVALFCTGGIRCEKASSLLLSKGFEEVYHLKGGILKYLEEVPTEESLWQGECFVFDERVALQHGLQPGNYRLCRSCGNPVARSPNNETIACHHCSTKEVS